jgi:AsmA protein
MSATRILKIALSILAGLIVLGVLFLWLWDFSRYRPDVETAVSEFTGREFRIDGAFDVDILPSPTILIEQATLSNADWSDEPVMIEVGRAYVRVGLWSLLFRPIVISELELSDVDARFQTNGDGDTNWDFGGTSEEPEETAEEGGDGEFPIDLQSADIHNIHVVYRQPESDDIDFVLDSLVVSTDDADRKLIEGQGQLSDTPVKLSGSIDGIQTDFEAGYGEVRLTSKTEQSDGSVNFALSLGSLSEVGKLVEMENLPVEDLSLDGNIALRGDTVVLSNVVASVTGLRVTIDGQLDGAASTVQLAVAAEGESLGLLKPGLPELPFSATADISLADENVDINPFDVRFGDSEMTGQFRVNGGDKPELTLTAESSLIDLRPFSSDEEAEAEADSSTDDSGSEYVFKDEPLPLDSLANLNANVDVAIAKLQLATSELQDIAVIASAEDGVLDVRNRFAGSYGGKYDNHLQLTIAGDQADLEIQTNVDDLKLAALSGSDIPADLIPATTVDLGITASGPTPRALAASTNGKLVLTQGPGRVRNDLIEKFSGDIIAQLFNALNPFAKEEEFTNWECSVFAIDFESGEGELTGFLLQSEKLMVVGGGDIDLNTEKLNIEFNTKPRAGVGISADMFVTPFVKLSGTLANPSVGLNQKGVLLSGGAAVLTGGLSFLYKGVMDRATAEGGQCEQALESVGLSPQPEPSGD